MEDCPVVWVLQSVQSPEASPVALMVFLQVITFLEAYM